MEQLRDENVVWGVMSTQPGKHWVLKQAPRVCCVDWDVEDPEKAQKFMKWAEEVQPPKEPGQTGHRGGKECGMMVACLFFPRGNVCCITIVKTFRLGNLGECPQTHGLGSLGESLGTQSCHSQHVC